MRKIFIFGILAICCLSLVADVPHVERRKPLTANVGVVSVGLDTYWKQCPGLYEDMVKKEQVFVRQLKAHQVEVTSFGMSDNPEKAKAMIPAKYGRIINIASMYGLVGNKIAPASPYHAAKGGVVNLTRALAAEWGKHGITVNSICPGYFYTPLTVETLNSEYFQNYAKQVIPLERYGNEGELDTAVLFLASPASAYVTGVALPVDGGYTCV